MVNVRGVVIGRVSAGLHMAGFEVATYGRFWVAAEAFCGLDVEDEWRSPCGSIFKVRTTNGKIYLVAYNKHYDQWTLESGFDGNELLLRTRVGNSFHGLRTTTAKEDAVR